MTRLAEEEVAREARRILRRLMAPRQALVARGRGRFAVGRGGAAQSRITVEETLVLAFARAGWIMGDGPGRFVLADAGRAFLVRSFRGEDAFAAQHRVMQSQVRDEPGGGVVRINAAE